jgi:hypothetical protein
MAAFRGLKEKSPGTAPPRLESSELCCCLPDKSQSSDRHHNYIPRPALLLSNPTSLLSHYEDAGLCVVVFAMQTLHLARYPWTQLRPERAPILSRSGLGPARHFRVFWFTPPQLPDQPAASAGPRESKRQPIGEHPTGPGRLGSLGAWGQEMGHYLMRHFAHEQRNRSQVTSVN